jgi:ABC-type nitrate/sulfonate/bicarbonate transport system substrate-binding protein
MTTSKKIWALVVIVLVVLISTAVIIELLEKPKLAGQEAEETQKTAESAEIEMTEIKMASTPRIFPYFPFFVAQQKNLFEANGLQVVFKMLETTDAIDALIEEEVDYMPSSLSTIKASLEGSPIKSIMALADGSPYFLVAQPGSELKDLRTIGVNSAYSAPHYQILKLIEDNSLPATISFLGNDQSRHITAMYEAVVDAVLLAPPHAFLLQDKGFSILDPFNNTKIMFSGLATRDDKIEDSPEEIKKIISAMQSATDFIRTNPQETKDILFEYFELERNETNIRAIEDTYAVATQYFSGVKPLSEENIEGVIRLAKAERFTSSKNVDDQSVSPEDVLKTFNFGLLETE